MPAPRRGEHWLIESDDTELRIRLESQFPLESLEDGQRSNTVQRPSPGGSEPRTQWVGGGSRIIRFRDSLVAEFNGDPRVLDSLALLRQLREYSGLLGRQPVVIFTWAELQVRAFAHVPTLTISDRWPGSQVPKVVTFSVELEVIPTEIDAVPVGETLWRRLAAGETFELLAVAHLGDPLRGELLRRANPKIANRFEQAGDLVRLLEPEHPDMQGSVRPTSAPFLGAWEEIVDAIGADRAQANGQRYEQLPEIADGSWFVRP